MRKRAKARLRVGGPLERMSGSRGNNYLQMLMTNPKIAVPVMMFLMRKGWRARMRAAVCR